jgi:hypothetical protein
MCGACGRTVSADPVFPGGRTTRGNLLAGQMIDRLCAVRTGWVRVAGSTEGFVVSAPGRRQAGCPTVADAWRAVLTAAPTASGTLHAVPDELHARYRGEHALWSRVLMACGLVSGE